MSESISSSKPSCLSSSVVKYSISKPSSNKRFSSKRSYFSTATIKPSFFGSGLEAFSKYSIYPVRPTMKMNEILDLSQINISPEDHEPGLDNWDRWLKIHKQQQEYLSGKLKRPPHCMIMNTSLNSLPTKQEKKWIAETSNFIEFDKYRGHPNFWKSDDMMENEQKPSATVYQKVQDKYDRSRQNYYPKHQEFEFVGISDEIFKEKGLSGKPCLPTPKNLWDKSPYVKERKEKLGDRLERVLEHSPELSEVFVVGKSLKKSDFDSIEINKDHCSNLESGLSTDFEPLLKPSFLMSVAIENEVIEKGSKLWTITFDNCFVNEMYDRSVTICNFEKSSALKYCWSMVLPHWVGNDLPVEHVKSRSKCFYFDKNNGAILPTAERKFVFYFKSALPGVYSEKWELQLNTNPDQWESVSLELQAVAVEKLDSEENLRSIDSYLEACTKYTIARKTVSSLIDRGRPERFEDIPYDWKLFEEQIFLHNNPDYFYDSECVSKLKRLFEKINNGPWDFSIKSLRDQLVQKSSGKSNTEDLELFTSTIYKLMLPSTPTLLLNEKHKTVYELLCCFITRMESESINLKLIYNIPVALKLSNEVELDNIIFPKTSLLSAKLSARANLSRKSGRKSSSKSRPSIGKMSLISEHTMDNDHLSTQLRVGDVSQSSIHSGFYDLKRKQEYLEALYIKTYSFLSQTIDHVSAVIDSFDNNSPKTILISLKK